MRTLIVTDIFGCTESLIEFRNQFFGEVEVVSPYEDGELTQNVQEKHAYDYYIKHLGHDAYADKVQESLIRFSPEFIVSFSAGATASWRALARTPLKRVQKMIAFYPGQIRNFTDLNPNCHVDIYFPEYEKHFELNPVISILKTIPCLSVVKARYFHGFMNRMSEAYNHDAYLHYSQICQLEQQILANLTDKRINSALA